MAHSARMAFVGAFFVLGCTATSAADPDEVWRHYREALGHVCPAKHLELLAPADLREVLDDYKRHAAGLTHVRMDRAEKRKCKASIAGAGCANLGDLEVAEKHGGFGPVAAAACSRFALCRDQSDCDAISVH